jgi:hypothetical protein
MALQKRGKYYYGDSQSDIRQEIARLSAEGDLASEFADAACRCGGKLFRLRMDDAQGAAVRICAACAHEHPIGDSDEYLAEAELDDCVCVCDGDQFEIYCRRGVVRRQRRREMALRRLPLPELRDHRRLRRLEK